MNSDIIRALILAVGIIIAGFMAGGRYTIVATEAETVARLDRWTGTVSMCAIGAAAEDPCGWVNGLPPNLADNQMQALENAALARRSN